MRVISDMQGSNSGGSGHHYQTLTRQLAIEKGKGYFLSFLAVVLWTGVGWLHPVLSLSENQALYIYSSQAQVIAAVYGLTITGYIFLQNQQDRKAEADESLAEVMGIVRHAQHSYVTFLTVLSISAILFALLAIAFREHSESLLKVITQNAAAAFFCLALLFTSRFVRDSMQPNTIENASTKLKTELEHVADLQDAPGFNSAAAVEESSYEGESPTQEIGSFEQFFRSFNRIESALERFAKYHLQEPVPVSGLKVHPFSVDAEPDSKRRRPTWTKSKIVRAIFERKLISRHRMEQLLEIIRYRNALAHGNDFHVPDDMLHRVSDAADVIESAIKDSDPFAEVDQ